MEIHVLNSIQSDLFAILVVAVLIFILVALNTARHWHDH